MKVFKPGKAAYVLVEKDDGKVWVMKTEVFEQFDPGMLDLGDIGKPSATTNAICAMYDLEGFTNFCKQIDPQLSVPSYLSGFLGWIFDKIRSQAVYRRFEEGIQLYHELPFFTKFLGDGLLILWDTSDMGEVAQHNVILNQLRICRNYLSEFLPSIKKKLCDPPEALRCGITKGTIYSVGDGNDFVGPCINLAGRLQKLPGARFAFARRGFDPELTWKQHTWLMEMVLKKAAIRGMGNEELIYLLKENFDKMADEDKALYHDP